MNHVPAEIRHPFSAPDDSIALKNPEPDNDVPVPVGVVPGVVDVEVPVPTGIVGAGEPVLVLYVTPLAGQFDVSPAIHLQFQYRILAFIQKSDDPSTFANNSWNEIRTWCSRNKSAGLD